MTAVFTRNNRDSASTPTTVVAVPQDGKPTPPTNLKYDFLKVAATPAPSPHPTGGESQAGGANPSVQRATALKTSVSSKLLVITGRAQDTGGTVNLHWDPVPNQTGPVIYKIYRANATGYFPTALQPDPEG